jgi:hypothetical protein
MPSTEASLFCTSLCSGPECPSEAGLTGAQQDGMAPSLVSGLSPIGLKYLRGLGGCIGYQPERRRVVKQALFGELRTPSNALPVIEQHIDVFREAV